MKRDLSFKLDYTVEELRAAAAVRRKALIREAAYQRAADRGFAPGHELDDWLDAELEVDRYLYG